MSNFPGRVSTSSSFRVPTTRPKVFNATLPHLSVARDHCRRPFREQNTPFRSRDNLGRLSREQNTPFRSRGNLGRPLREQNAAFRSRDNLGRPFREQNAPSRSRGNLGRPSRERNAPSRSRDNLGRPFREQNAPFRSRDALAYPFVSRMRRLAHETTSELSCATGTLRELYGNSTGAPRCRRGSTRASGTRNRT